ncbi:TRAP transporter substrate-binding protein DctP [Uliginosibacterium aquaticum]|uniref:TRAP transporter substrate-binding protein DctP n=1 Tax=Uliginosibacterium aquaticum TaxID=2731212 RepID=A0ABX2IBV9_9RHOO|nr:TRAP transporter substrate-binding protein DctP [Uliginosibacterium aquaticum]NSL53959.1 TRAP transporter substrate-binding protein DctP [Uliginosibacterium aquaticum]
MTSAPLRRILIAAALACSSLAAGAAELKGWVREADDYPQHQGLQYFFDRLKLNSQGKHSGKVICCEEMGQQKDVIPKFSKGEVDVVLFTSSALQDDVPEMRILNLPFLFRDPEHMMSALNGEVGKELQVLMEEKGYIALTWYDGGARSFYSNKKSLSYASDFKGLKIRLPKRQDLIAMATALGAEASTIGFDKVPAAFKAGELDVAENDLTSYYTSEHYKIAPYYTFSYHLVQPIVMLISKQRWSSLSTAEKGIVQQSAIESAAYAAKVRAQADSALKSKLEKAGVKFAPFRGSATTISLMKDAYAPVVASQRTTALMVKIMTGSRKAATE